MKTSSPIILFLFLSVQNTFIQAQWRVTSCEEAGISDNVGEGVLKTYFHEDPNTGLGGLGCWAHHHENGKDMVITPHSWGREPNSPKKGLIKAVMDAMTDSRNVYSAFGSMDNGLMYLLNDVRYDDGGGEAFWIDNNNQCWMRSGMPSLRTHGTTANKKQVFAHEIGHCFIMENVPALTRENYNLNEWADESIAEYLGSLVYPGNDLEHVNARDFQLEEAFSQAYSAYIFWQFYLSKIGHPERVDEIFNELVSNPTVATQIKYLREKDVGPILQQFYFEHYQKRLPDPGGGTIPRKPVVAPATELAHFLDPHTDSPFFSGKLRKARLSLYKLELPAGYDVRLRWSIEGVKKPYLSIISDRTSVPDWVNPSIVEGNCGKTTTIEVLISHMFNNPPLEKLKITYDLVERTDCCPIVKEPNPSVKHLNGNFKFDYYIESEAVGSSDGEMSITPFNYYVNSRDGSMLLTQEVIASTFGSYKGGGFVMDAVIWFPNGQLVAYVVDNTGTKRAMTLDMNQTRGDIMGVRFLEIDEFLSKAGRSGIRPSPLPSGSIWINKSEGRAYTKNDPRNPGERLHITGYMSNEKSIASSPLAAFGFMVGYIKDENGIPKNLVFTRAKLSDGSSFEVHLKKFRKECASFEAKGYKKATLGGYTGSFSAMSDDEIEEFGKRQESYNDEMMALLSEMSACGKNPECLAKFEKKMLALTKKREDDVFNLPEDLSHSGSKGSRFKENQQMIREQMLEIQNLMVDVNLKCEKISQSLRRCEKSGGDCSPLRKKLDQCRKEKKDLEASHKKLECEMASLMGMEDMMDDCK